MQLVVGCGWSACKTCHSVGRQHVTFQSSKPSEAEYRVPLQIARRLTASLQPQTRTGFRSAHPARVTLCQCIAGAASRTTPRQQGANRLAGIVTRCCCSGDAATALGVDPFQLE